MRTLTARALVAVGAVLLIIQIVPYGRDHSNPPVQAEPPWDAPETRAVFLRVCGNCHSHETRWPWYSYVAPASWLVQYDVREARSHFNVSAWDADDPEGEEAAGLVRKGEMPPWFYLPAHPEARLDPDEKGEFVRGLVATFGDEAHDHEAHSHQQ